MTTHFVSRRSLSPILPEGQSPLLLPCVWSGGWVSRGCVRKMSVWGERTLEPHRSSVGCRKDSAHCRSFLLASSCHAVQSCQISPPPFPPGKRYEQFGGERGPWSRSRGEGGNAVGLLDKLLDTSGLKSEKSEQRQVEGQRQPRAVAGGDPSRREGAVLCRSQSFKMKLSFCTQLFLHAGV